MKNIRVISDSDIDVVLGLLGCMPTGSKIISIYGLNGRHVAWVAGPEPTNQNVDNKNPKKGK